jgi:hypothetical protein
MTMDDVSAASHEDPPGLLPAMKIGLWVGAACGAIWGLGAGPALWLPPALAASPWASALLAALEGAAMVGGLSVVGAALYALVRAIAVALGHSAAH